MATLSIDLEGVSEPVFEKALKLSMTYGWVENTREGLGGRVRVANKSPTNPWLKWVIPIHIGMWMIGIAS